jgi:hypothetical protein
VLYERLQRELATGKPLSREPQLTQRRQFETLMDKLSDTAGIIAGGPTMVAILAKRSRRFDIVGGIEDIRLTTDTAMGWIDEILAAEKNLLGRRQQQGVGTYLRHAIDKLDGISPAELITLRRRIGETELPDAMKKALAARIPDPVVTKT